MYNILELASELKRLKTLLHYQILDTPQEYEFDVIVKIAAAVFDVPVAAITFIDEHRQWIKASVGLNVCQTEREHAVCNFTIQRNTINEVVDMREEQQYRHLPVVTTEPFYRYYAGMPLTAGNSCNIGAICIMDTTARRLTQEEKDLLSTLGSITITQMEICLKNKDLNKIHQMQNRLLALIHQHTAEPGLSACLEAANSEKNNLMNTDDLNELYELLYRQNNHTLYLLNQHIEEKQIKLRQALNKIKNNHLKEIITNIVFK